MGGGPSSSARLQILAPQPGEAFRGDPASAPARFHLIGAKFVSFTSTRLVTNEGHIHLILDGALVSMSYSLAKDLQVTPGVHRLQAEFVALDHRPFNPRVQAFVKFQVVP